MDQRTLIVANGGAARAEVASHGAQVLSWSVLGRERLYLSPRAVFAPGSAIRGGIPVIFPQFGTRGDGPRHGFARAVRWRRADVESATGTPSAVAFEVAESTSTLSAWPYRFRARTTVALTHDSLAVTLDIHNTGTEAFRFSAALHTYLRLHEMPQARLRGLENRPYVDALDADRNRVQEHLPLDFNEAIDRIYPGACGPLLLEEDNSRIRIDSTGFPDTVIWNPGTEQAARTADLGPDEHRRFACVESAAVEPRVCLMPGQSWSGLQRLTVLT